MSKDTARRVPDDEELSIDLLLEKFHQDAILNGTAAKRIGWPEELHISGPNMIRLLSRVRDDAYHALEDVKKALDDHRVPNPEGLSQADRIHLLVGRKTR